MKTLLFCLVLPALFVSGMASGCVTPCGDYERCDYDTSECVCDYGFTGSPGNCTDINECEYESPCVRVEGSECNNTAGSYECVCDPGYVLCGDSCIPEGTCPQCGNYSYCSCSTDFECRCEYGFTGEDGFCEDIDECADNSTCGYVEYSVCMNLLGGYNCACQDGYVNCGDSCILEGACPSDCGNNTYCGCSTNFECRCNYGYTNESGSCEDIDECADNSTCDYIEGSQCVNTPGGYDCVCPDGYVSCEDACIPEGTCPDCGSNSYCGCSTDYECRCNYGYTGTGVNGSCEDIDECADSSLCDYLSGGVCVNDDGGYECMCAPGYIRCYATNECILDENKTCPPCDNGYCDCYTDYECRCNYGFTGVDGSCEDIDECADECNSYCSYPEGSVCYNTYGSYECACPPGYVNCYSSYKCIYNETCPSCGQNEVCNCDTGFVCECDYGYKRDADGYCVDINECDNATTCQYKNGSVCYNTPGSYDCDCQPGYVECYENYQCTLNGTCSECGNDSYCGCSTNFECRCRYGFTGESGSCEDINECLNTSICDYKKGSVCNNSIGSYDCACPDDHIQCYLSDGYTYACVGNATCPECGVNEYCGCETEFECRCGYGFTGVDGSCEDINECVLSDYNPCGYEEGSGRECVNTYGSYDCSCPPGYYFCSTLYQCVSLYDVIRLEPTSMEDRYECYPYDTMDERRDIRCQVKSIIEEKLSLLFREPPENGSGRPENPSGRPGGP